MEGTTIMHRLVRIVALVAVVALLGSVTATANHGGTNLIHNGSFEKDRDDDFIPDAWVIRHGNGPNFQHVAGGRHGIHRGLAAGTSLVGRYRVVQHIGGITPGMSYQFTGWVNDGPFDTEPGFTILIEMAWFNTDAVIGVDLIHEMHTAPSDWEKITNTVTAPQGTSYGVLRITVYDLDGAIAFDTFSLSPVVD
jgi:hypothetical protein